MSYKAFTLLPQRHINRNIQVKSGLMKTGTSQLKTDLIHSIVIYAGISSYIVSLVLISNAYMNIVQKSHAGSSTVYQLLVEMSPISYMESHLLTT